MTPDDVQAAGLSPGLAMHLEFPGAQLPVVHARVRDMVVGEYVDLSITGIRLQADLCDPQVPWLLRYVRDHTAIAAATNFLAYTRHPLDGVRVAFPRQLSAHAARVYRRVLTRQTVHYKVLQDDHPKADVWMGTIFHDLSLGGCALWAADPLAPDTRVSIELPVYRDGAPVQVEATIRRCVEGDDESLVGLQFDDLDPQQRSALVQLLGAEGLTADPLVERDD